MTDIANGLMTKNTVLYWAVTLIKSIGHRQFRYNKVILIIDDGLPVYI